MAYEDARLVNVWLFGCEYRLTQDQTNRVLALSDDDQRRFVELTNPRAAIALGFAEAEPDPALPPITTPRGGIQFPETPDPIYGE